MRWDGRMACGSWGAVFTGHSLFFSPAFTALTSARLSFFVRPLIVGTVIGGSFAAESFVAPVAVLDAARPVAVPVDATPAEAVDDAVVAGDASATWVPSGGTSPEGDGRASLLAAQATDAEADARIRALTEKNLLNKNWLIGILVTRWWG